MWRYIQDFLDYEDSMKELERERDYISRFKNTNKLKIRIFKAKEFNKDKSYESDIKEEVADLMVNTWDKYAPGFKKSIRKLHIESPMDIQRNNPSAVMGHMAGGAMIPSQAGPNRPLAGVCQGGASRTYIKDLYISNSIHPNGQSAISSGYIAASEVAEDMGAREQSWWKYKAFQWMKENKDKIEVIKG